MNNNFSNIFISNSICFDDYEILIKQKHQNGFMAYCPQINQLVNGDSYDQVLNNIENIINNHINNLINDMK